jgi:hypothetical protein
MMGGSGSGIRSPRVSVAVAVVSVAVVSVAVAVVAVAVVAVGGWQ